MIIKEDVINDVVLLTTNILRRINHLLLTTRLIIRASASVGIYLIQFLMIKIKKQKLRQ